MRIDFTSSRWSELKDIYEKWWKKELSRPIIAISHPKDNISPDPLPNVPVLSQKSCHDLSVSAEDLIEKLDYSLSNRVYLGDAYPKVNLSSFGPGVVAAFLGCRLDNSSGGVWFYPPDNAKNIEDIHFKYDKNNVWLKRIKEICAAGIKKWNGQVMIGMPDMGGTMDILASVRTTEELLFDLYDNEKEVKRLINEIHELWFKFYDEINEILQPVNPGYSDWNSIFSQTPSYILQCDFSYMIGNEMFCEFALDEIKRSCKRLHRSYYHLDGINSLPHLETLLKIEELNAIQWVPGDGQPGCDAWGDVYRKIRAAGKNAHIFGKLDVVPNLYNELGDLKSFSYVRDHNDTNPEQAKQIIKEYAK